MHISPWMLSCGERAGRREETLAAFCAMLAECPPEMDWLLLEDDVAFAPPLARAAPRRGQRMGRASAHRPDFAGG